MTRWPRLPVLHPPLGGWTGHQVRFWTLKVWAADSKEHLGLGALVLLRLCHKKERSGREQVVIFRSQSQWAVLEVDQSHKCHKQQPSHFLPFSDPYQSLGLSVRPFCKLSSIGTSRQRLQELIQRSVMLTVRSENFHCQWAQPEDWEEKEDYEHPWKNRQKKMNWSPQDLPDWAPCKALVLALLIVNWDTQRPRDRSSNISCKCASQNDSGWIWLHCCNPFSSCDANKLVCYQLTLYEAPQVQGATVDEASLVSPGPSSVTCCCRCVGLMAFWQAALSCCHLSGHQIFDTQSNAHLCVDHASVFWKSPPMAVSPWERLSRCLSVLPQGAKTSACRPSRFVSKKLHGMSNADRLTRLSWVCPTTADTLPNWAGQQVRMLGVSFAVRKTLEVLN